MVGLETRHKSPVYGIHETALPVVIVGGGLGGLSAAIHLRLHERAVTVFESNERVGGRANLIEREGFRFDTGPSLLNYPWIFEDLFRRAGRRMSDYVTLLPVDPSVSFQWPDGQSLSLSSRFDRLLAEFERIEPGSGPQLLAFLHDAGIKYRIAFDKLVSRNEDNPVRWFAGLSPRELSRLSVWRSLYGELGRFFRSRYIKEALGSYGMYLGGSPFDLPGFFTILPYGELAYGLWLPKGGVYGLVSGMERLARELGVTICTGCRVSRVSVENGRVAGVLLEGGGFQRADVVVSNVDVPTTDTALVAGDKSLDRRREQGQRQRMTPGVITFYWGVRGQVRNLRHHTIFLPADYAGSFRELLVDKRVPKDLPFYVSVASATDPDLAPPGDSAVFVLVPTPLLSQMPDADWRQEAERVKGQVLDRLAHHGIDLTPDRIVTEEIYTPAEWRDRFGLHDGSAFGTAHTLFQVGPFRMPNHASEVDGLYYVGASTTPGTGMPMVVLGGRLTAERIAAHARQSRR